MESALSLTKYWLQNIVIELDLCPFAKIPFENDQIRVVVCEDPEEDAQMLFFLKELEFLNLSTPMDVSTTVVVYSSGSNDFMAFNDFVGELEEMIAEANLSSVFQLVTFHPEFVFVDTDFKHRGNLVNRSPFPILHILRSEEIARVMKNPKDGELVSFNNDKKLHELSTEAIDRLFYYLKK